MPKPGEILLITKAASVQFAAPLLFSVRRVFTLGSTPQGWVWLAGYELDRYRDAVEKREIFVQLAGLRPAPERQAPPAAPVRRPVNRGPVPIPKQRTSTAARSHR